MGTVWNTDPLTIGAFRSPPLRGSGRSTVGRMISRSEYPDSWQPWEPSGIPTRCTVGAFRSAPLRGSGRSAVGRMISRSEYPGSCQPWEPSGTPTRSRSALSRPAVRWSRRAVGRVAAQTLPIRRSTVRVMPERNRGDLLSNGSPRHSGDRGARQPASARKARTTAASRKRPFHSRSNDLAVGVPRQLPTMGTVWNTDPRTIGAFPARGDGGPGARLAGSLRRRFRSVVQLSG